MVGWVGNIDDETVHNASFRRVLFTGRQMQLTVMRLKPGEEIGVEKHADLDQFIRVEAGRALVSMGSDRDSMDQTHDLLDDWAVVIPAGTWHNVVNAGQVDLSLYSLYAPPEHAAGSVHETKADADAAEAAHHR
ncbi:MAG: cupin domain-containing protein [Nostocoides sp.]